MTPTKHKHKFVDYIAQATGYWQKRECPGDGVAFAGKVQRCTPECGVMRFVSNEPGLYAVECTPKIEKGDKR